MEDAWASSVPTGRKLSSMEQETNTEGTTGALKDNGGNCGGRNPWAKPGPIIMHAAIRERRAVVIANGAKHGKLVKFVRVAMSWIRIRPAEPGLVRVMKL